jgi:hypothetical protein
MKRRRRRRRRSEEVKKPLEEWVCENNVLI